MKNGPRVATGSGTVHLNGKPANLVMSRDKSATRGPTRAA